MKAVEQQQNSTLMESLNLLTSACRRCRYYQPEGRRGGMCQMLAAPVQGNWKACSLAIPTFAPTLEALEGMMLLSASPPVLSSVPIVAALESAAVGSAINVYSMESSELTINHTRARQEAEPILM